MVTSAHPNNNCHGFTLVEVIIVVAILAILTSIAIPAYRGYVTISKQKSAEAMIEQFPILLETFRAENGSFPPNATYTYTETDTGTPTDNIGGNGAGQAGLSGFTPRPASYPPNKGILYHYTLTITNSGTVNESASFQALPQTGRGAPPGNVPSSAATYD